MTFSRPAMVCALLNLAACQTASMSGMLPRWSGAPEAPAQISLPASAPRIDVTIASHHVSGLMGQISSQDDVSEWRSADGIGLTLKDGMVIATRGFGPDLLIADADGALQALRDRGGHYARRMHHLDGEGRDRVDLFDCNLAADPAIKSPLTLTETCLGTDHDFHNTYSLSSSGRLLHSSQWIGPDLGNIDLSPL